MLYTVGVDRSLIPVVPITPSKAELNVGESIRSFYGPDLKCFSERVPIGSSYRVSYFVPAKTVTEQFTGKLVNIEKESKFDNVKLSFETNNGEEKSLSSSNYYITLTRIA